MEYVDALLLDDDHDSREILRRISREGCFRLSEFSDTMEASRKMDEGSISIAFVDLMLIIADDYCFFRKLRSCRPFIKVFILVSVASNRSLDFSRFEDAFTLLLEKPLDYDMAKEKISTALKQQKLL